MKKRFSSLLPVFALLLPSCFYALAPVLKPQGLLSLLRPLGVNLGALLSWLFSLFPLPFSEICWLLLLPLGLYFCLLRPLFKKRPRAAMMRTLSALSAVFTLWSSVFLVQYSAPPLSSRLGLETYEYTKEELYSAARLLAEDLNEAAQSASRSQNGLYSPPSLENMLPEIRRSMKEGSLSSLIPAIMPAPAKSSFFLSKALAYLGITGYYFPLTGEQNVSACVAPASLAFTAAHETAHALGIGPEKEANFAAFLCCLESNDPDIVYSGLLNGYIYLNNSLYAEDPELWQSLYSSLSQSVRDDLAAKNAHYDQYEGPVREVGSAVNDAYIKATGQPQGVKSYGLVTDLIVCFYLSD